MLCQGAQYWRQFVLVTKFCAFAPNFVAPQYETCFISPLWPLEFWYGA